MSARGVHTGSVQLAGVVSTIALISWPDSQFAEHIIAAPVLHLFHCYVRATRRLVVQQLLVMEPEDVRRVPLHGHKVDQAVERQVIPVSDQNRRTIGDSMF